MMKNTNSKRTNILFRVLALCLCAVLLAGGACAEETRVVNLGGNGFSALSYGDTLPDGRILLSGYREIPDDPAAFPRLLCLNSDRTVSWDYVDTANRNAGFTHASVLPDGTIGVVLEKNLLSGSRNTFVDLRFFTQDGKPTGKEINIPVNGTVIVCAASKSRLDLMIRREEDQILEILPNCLYDWDGNEIGMVEGLDCFALSRDMIEEPDGLVMYGSEPSLHEPRTVIWKTDGGNKLLWKAELPYVWNEADILGFEFFTGTGDGGYLGILTEGRQGKDEQENEYRTVLAKLDNGERSCLVNSQLFADIADPLEAFGEYGGKYAAVFRNENGPDNVRLDNPLIIRWFDESGTDLGTAELELKLEDFDWLADFLQAPANGESHAEMRIESRMFPMEDGLWVPAVVYTATRLDDWDYSLVGHDSYRYVLIRIPEP